MLLPGIRLNGKEVSLFPLSLLQASVYFRYSSCAFSMVCAEGLALQCSFIPVSGLITKNARYFAFNERYLHKDSYTKALTEEDLTEI